MSIELEIVSSARILQRYQKNIHTHECIPSNCHDRRISNHVEPNSTPNSGLCEARLCPISPVVMSNSIHTKLYTNISVARCSLQEESSKGCQGDQKVRRFAHGYHRRQIGPKVEHPLVEERYPGCPIQDEIENLQKEKRRGGRQGIHVRFR